VSGARDVLSGVLPWGRRWRETDLWGLDPEVRRRAQEGWGFVAIYAALTVSLPPYS
jgi:hypothetical protein